MLNFLIKNNLLPYIAIAIMGYMIYYQHKDGILKDIALANAKEQAELQNDNIGFLVGYTDNKFAELEKVRTSKWKEGKHEKVIHYDNK